MSKKNINPINLPRRLREGLEEAYKLEKHPAQALELLQELDRKFPRQLDVLSMMSNAYMDMNDRAGYLQAMYQLHDLTPNRAEVKLGLAGAYLSNDRFALALQTFRQFLKQWPQHERVASARDVIAKLEQGLADFLADIDFTLETGFDFARKNEEMQVLMEFGQYERCKQLAKSLLAQRPNFAPTLNNLCQIYWLEGNLTAAIETAQKTLAVEPDNIHAFSNLTRFLFMQGKTEEAQGFAKRLKESSADAFLLSVKKIEAFSFIVDDEGVLSALAQAKKARELDDLNAHTWHLCAVAAYRMGDTAKARAHWQKSLQLSPNFLLANANLEELKKPIFERMIPQVFSSAIWLADKTIAGLGVVIEKNSALKNDEERKRKIGAYMDEHPEIIQFVAAALPWGDADARKLALQLVTLSAHPKLIAILEDFALGQSGSDAQRLEAAQMLTKLGVVESGQTMNLWHNGEQKPIMMLGFEIFHESPEKLPLKPTAHRLMEQAVDALYKHDDRAAEGFLRQALEIQPDEPSLLNNLALALLNQGKKDEADVLAEHVANDFPDYFFGQIIAARKAILAKDLEKAKAIIDKMLKKKQLHVTEFSGLCACQIDLMIAQDMPEGAQSWLDMWKQGYPDDPTRKDYESKIAIFGALSKIKNFSASRRKKK